jgi:hypothetical protein
MTQQTWFDFCTAFFKGETPLNFSTGKLKGNFIVEKRDLMGV